MENWDMLDDKIKQDFGGMGFNYVTLNDRKKKSQLFIHATQTRAHNDNQGLARIPIPKS